jgi:hypothetical protein
MSVMSFKSDVVACCAIAIGNMMHAMTSIAAQA